MTRVIRLLGRTTGILFTRKQTLSNATPWLLQRAYVHNTPANDPLSSARFIEQANHGTVQDLVETSSVSLPTIHGELASVGLGGYGPIGLFQSALEWMHVTVGLPWWASIMSFTILLKLALLPVTVGQQRSAVRINNIRLQVEKYLAKIHQTDDDHVMAAQGQVQLMELYKEHNCHPMHRWFGFLLQVCKRH